jgi:hypothetical protein
VLAAAATAPTARTAASTSAGPAGNSGTVEVEDLVVVDGVEEDDEEVLNEVVTVVTERVTTPLWLDLVDVEVSVLVGVEAVKVLEIVVIVTVELVVELVVVAASSPWGRPKAG